MRHSRLRRRPHPASRGFAWRCTGTHVTGVATVAERTPYNRPVQPAWIFGLPGVLVGYGLFAFVRGRNRPRWASALGWVALWILPAIVVQCAWLMSHYSGSLPEVWFFFTSAWVLLGGGSVIAVFEATVRDLTGHRQSTMLDNAHVFLALTALQCAPFIAILARRGVSRWRDPVALAIGAAFLVNALLGARWPWWGT